MAPRLSSLFFVTVLALSVFDFTVAFRADYTHVNINGYYKFHQDIANWPSAKKNCEVEGGILFHPNDEHELEAVLSAFSINSSYLWVGMSYWDTDQYKTVDGRLIDDVYKKWSSNEPIVGLNKEYQCCRLNVQPRELRMSLCSISYPYVCKLRLSTETLMLTSMEEIKTVVVNDTERLAKAIEHQAVLSHTQAANQATAAARSSETIQRQLLASYRQQETMKQYMANQTTILEKQSSALEYQSVLLGRLVGAMTNLTYVMTKIQEDDNRFNTQPEQ